MNNSNSADLKMIIYAKKLPVITCKPDFLGFMGVFLKGIHLGYPVGTPLEIEFRTQGDNIKGQRISMLVNNTEDNGTGLRLKNFEKDVISKWRNALQLLKGI